MKLIPYHQVALRGGYLFEKQELNTSTTIHAVYDRFHETGRITAFKFGFPEKDPVQPHFFWDSDVAKWMEGAAYILRREPHPDLEAKVDEIVDDIEKNQCEDGYFNIFFTVVQPENRWANRDWHELYCAGHLMEAAVAYAEATGKTKFLTCMEKYADYIAKVFMEEHSATFHTPGHEEIELALVKMYRHTGKRKYLDMAAYFINTRGTVEEFNKTAYNQAHLPVREQDSALGHCVRAVYLYTGMAYLAKETGDKALISACKKLWEDISNRKMYITGGLGSTYIGEAFTSPYDLPSDQAYTETCAGIALCFFANAMLALDNNAAYADVIERVLYNGVLSGLSTDGTQFFYENPLEINLSERFSSAWGARRFPAHRRVACFACSCCPPNLNRLLASLGNYVYGTDGDVLYVNQFAASELKTDGITATMETDYPRSGKVTVTASGASVIAIRIPAWCEHYSLDQPYTLQNGYALVKNPGGSVSVEFDLTPRRVWADIRVLRTAGQVAIMRGPVVYCAEGVDNGEGELHSYIIPADFTSAEEGSEAYGLPTLTVPCLKQVADGESLYRNTPPKTEAAVLKLIPYNAFANRTESDMRVWFLAE
ncbi:MAG: glycoside hydrolase family 127 protein [Clostridia bacterium]|nr:glycoside hydrolase family 127 protein [Clostridia bacterium]